eukprot:373264_1
MSLSSSYDSLRNVYKFKMVQALTTVKNSEKFKEIQNKLDLNNYQFVMSDPTHFDEILSLISKNYVAKNPFGQIFNMTKDDVMTAMKARVGFTCKYGRMILAINSSNGKIEGGISCWDLCDKQEIDVDASSDIIQSQSGSEMMELFEYVYQNINQDLIPKDMYKIVTNNVKTTEELKHYYGKYIYSGGAFVDSNNPKIFFVLAVLSGLLITKTGYTSHIGEVSHLRMYEMAKRFGSIKISEIENIPSFQFKNGKTMNYYFNEYAKKFGVKSMKQMKKHFTLNVMFSTSMNIDQMWKAFFTRSKL